MIISKNKLLQDAENMGFRREILEKVYTLTGLIEAINNDNFLKTRLVLKGGTALNLFHFNLARLSVDADYNYVGTLDASFLEEEKRLVSQRVELICGNLGFSLIRQSGKYAGCKYTWRYNSVFGNKGNIEVDINYIYRTPLLPIEYKDSSGVIIKGLKSIALLDIHELAAGKLSALVSRCVPRDIFDTHFLLTKVELNIPLLRSLFVIYSAISRKTDIRDFRIESINCGFKLFHDSLYPMLRNKKYSGIKELKRYHEELIQECQSQLSILFRLENNERSFLTKIFNDGVIDADCFKNTPFANKIALHPGLQWTAHNVKRNIPKD